MFVNAPASANAREVREANERFDWIIPPPLAQQADIASEQPTPQPRVLGNSDCATAPLFPPGQM